MATADDFRKGMHFDHKSAVMLANYFLIIYPDMKEIDRVRKKKKNFSG
jgi:hypothetical protein